jgi:2-phospho-L-lactate guanylyltransferase (CobY/MobA/RfbA family)
MPSVVVPFRGESAKRRLAPAPDEVRMGLAQAMLADVVAASEAVGPTQVVTGGGGQGPDVERALHALEPGPVLVVNADLPCVQPRDLLTLLGALPAEGLALVPAADGTTNALALSAPHLFAPLYGPGSAARFRAHSEALGVPFAEAAVPNLVDDVDTLADLERLEGRLGPHTAAALEALRTGLPR